MSPNRMDIVPGFFVLLLWGYMVAKLAGIL
jgi:hypothetical protein